jgi:hypothetical protein
VATAFEMKGTTKEMKKEFLFISKKVRSPLFTSKTVAIS